MTKLNLIDPDSFEGQPLSSVMRLLIGEINELKILADNDSELRAKNPALQDAWEQYQTVRTL